MYKDKSYFLKKIIDNFFFYNILNIFYINIVSMSHFIKIILNLRISFILQNNKKKMFINKK